MHLPWDHVEIGVVGDVMLDEYLDGIVNRISPEAPVPVHLVKNRYCVLGGAANSAANIEALGGIVRLFSVLGADDTAKDIQNLIAPKDIYDHMHYKQDRLTTRKTRIISQGHQICRVDRETTNPISQHDAYELEANVRSQSESLKAILLSDYNKGVLTTQVIRSILEGANEKGIPVVVDPKGRDFTRYVGATLITPNRKEACEALQIDSNDSVSGEELGKQLQAIYGFRNVLVTLGAEGMVLVQGSGIATHLPTLAQEVFDVSGAGDTVAAVMTLGLGACLPIEEVMFYANTAAAIAVSRHGTHAVTVEELQHVLTKKTSSMWTKFSNWWKR